MSHTQTFTITSIPCRNDGQKAEVYESSQMQILQFLGIV